MSDDAWSLGERVLEEIGMNDQPHPNRSRRRDIPAAASELNTAAMHVLGGGVLICPLSDVVLSDEPEQPHEVHSDEWLAAEASVELEAMR